MPISTIPATANASSVSPNISQAITAVRASREVTSATVMDAAGHRLAGFTGRSTPGAAVETIEKPVRLDGRTVGRFILTVERPSLAPMLPQFIALTFVLLFGGVGVALFLARSLAHAVSPEALGPFFDAYGVELPDVRRIDFYVLLDELA